MTASRRKARRPLKGTLVTGSIEPIGRSLIRKVGGREIDTHSISQGLAAAVKKAERLGRPVQVAFIVDPKPKLAVREIKLTESDALDSALQAARERGAARIADILAGRDMLSADAFAKEIGVTRETVNSKRKRHEVLGLAGPKRGIRFPKWQLSASGDLLPGLPDLFRVLGEHPWSVYRFLLTKHPELGGKRGLDALRSGRVSEVLDVAKSVTTGTFA